MIQVLIPSDFEFLKYDAQIKDLYEKNQEKINDSNSYEFIKNNTLFYLFLKNKNVLGVVYYFKDGDKLFVNGFSNRKNHLANLYSLKLSTTWFSCSIYAEAQNRASALCLLRCGFKRLKGNLFILQKTHLEDLH